jgi:hypothetical protein
MKTDISSQRVRAFLAGCSFLLLSGPAFSQAVDARTAICADSTCQHRTIALSAGGTSSSSTSPTGGSSVLSTAPPSTTPNPPPPQTCFAGSTADAPVACGPGYSGTKFTTTTITCPGGPYGQPSSSTSGYDTSGCISSAPPSVVPPPLHSIDCRGYKTGPGAGSTCVVYCAPGACPHNMGPGSPPLIGSCWPSGDGNGTQYCTYPLTWQ